MSIEVTIVALNCIAAIAALVGAFFWFRSATLQVAYKNEPDADGFYSAVITTGENTDFINTVIAQSLWSKRGACSCGIAALLQGFALLLQIFKA